MAKTKTVDEQPKDPEVAPETTEAGPVRDPETGAYQPAVYETSLGNTREDF